MKVKELIAKLQEFDGEMKVVTEEDYRYDFVSQVREITIIEVSEDCNIEYDSCKRRFDLPNHKCSQVVFIK